MPKDRLTLSDIIANQKEILAEAERTLKRNQDNYNKHLLQDHDQQLGPAGCETCNSYHQTLDYDRLKVSSAQGWLNDLTFSTTRFD